MLVKRAQMTAKAEAVEGTAETLAGADAFLAENINFNPETEMGDRNPVTSGLSQFSKVAGARKATMEFDVELKGSGTAGTAPAIGKLLISCGFAETLVAITSATYKPASTGDKSMSLAMYNDGVRYGVFGARGNVSIKALKGKPVMLHFVFTGADYTVTDAALLTTGVTYEATKPLPFMAATMTLDSYAAMIGSMEFNMNNEVALRDDVNATSGHKSAVITGRKPSLSIDPEMVLVATYDFFGKLRSGSEGALTLALTGSAGNIATITAPKVQYTKVGLADKSGIRSLGIDCQLNRNAGDDEIVIAFT